MKSDPIDDGILHFKALPHAPADDAAPARTGSTQSTI